MRYPVTLIDSEAIPGGDSADDDNSALEPKKNTPQTRKHGIQKRQAPPDFLAAWQVPLFYKACALSSGLGSKIVKPLYAKLFGPFGLVTSPLIPGVLTKMALAGVCPPASVLAWFLASGINPAPGV